MISKELEDKKKEYNKLLDRYFKAESWFKLQDDTYFDNVEGKKEYKAFTMIIEKLNILFNEIKAAEQQSFIMSKNVLRKLS